jgi:hypothetical protein
MMPLMATAAIVPQMIKIMVIPCVCYQSGISIEIQGNCGIDVDQAGRAETTRPAK